MRPLSMCLSLLSVSLFAAPLSATTPPAAKPPATKPPAAKPPAAPKDLAFQCSYTPSQLTNWNPSGVSVAGASRTKFKKLAAFGSAAASRACKGLPPASAVTPGARNGGIVRGDIVVAQQDVPVYRAYSKGPFTCSLASPATNYGAWWSLEPLGANKSTYRQKVAVCPSWNDFTMKISCTLKKGAAVIVGPSQSAGCTPGPNKCTKPAASFTVTYPASTSHQVFINTRSADRSKFLTGCTMSAW